MELLRLTTMGSVDDGKSTLIGRLLLDTRELCDDHWETLERVSRRRGYSPELALLCDGLKAEREQNITIDVAHRFLSTPRRKFIIADAPGHEQYTRNMVTAASTAEAAVLLLDATRGPTTQTHRHAFIASLLEIPHIVVAINKMDRVDYSQARFHELRGQLEEFFSRLTVDDVVYLPISAAQGDNVVEPSPQLDWFNGPTLLHHLENVKIGASQNVVDFRYPVQFVLRGQGRRALAGKVASGRVRPGDEVMVLPSGQKSSVRRIFLYHQEKQAAFPGESVALELEHELDVGRGHLLVRTHNLPFKASSLDATLCWMNDRPLELHRSYLLLHGASRQRARVTRLLYAIEVDALRRRQASQLGLNDLGRVKLETHNPLYFDAYARNRETGAFLLVDPDSKATVAAGMLRGPWREYDAGEKPAASKILWFMGLSGSGKTTLSEALQKTLRGRGLRVASLDGDVLRAGLCGDLGFDLDSRRENLRRAAETAKLLSEHVDLVLCSFITPLKAHRQMVAEILGERYRLLFVDCPLDECRRRDPKGLYARADSGELPQFTGISSPFEEPEKPFLRLDTSARSIDELVGTIVESLGL